MRSKRQGGVSGTGLSVSTSWSVIRLPMHGNWDFLLFVKSNGHFSILIFLDHLILLTTFYLFSILTFSAFLLYFWPFLHILICGLLLFGQLFKYVIFNDFSSFLLLLSVYSSGNVHSYSWPPYPPYGWLLITYQEGITNDPKTQKPQTTENISHGFCGLGIQEQLSWVVLAHGLLRGHSQLEGVSKMAPSHGYC